MLNPSFSDNWFKHDLYSLSDTNIQLMLRELGPAGYGVFWATIEKLYQNGDDGLDGRDIIVLAQQIGTTAEMFTKALDVMVRNKLLVYGADKRYRSKRVSEASKQKASNYASWLASKSAAGQASGRARRERRDAKNKENEHVLNTNEHVLNTNERIEETDQKRQKSQRETDDPQTPYAGEAGQSVVVPSSPQSVGNPILGKLDHGQLASLEESWGKDNVAKAADILADRVRNGRLQVRNVYGALNGLLAKLGRDGDISKPKPQRKMPCPSVDGSCPKCGAPLRQTSADGHEWECHACGIRYTSDGGSGWIEEQIGVMARMA